MRRLIPVLALLAAVAAADPAVAKPEDAQVGHVRAAFARQGTPILDAPTPLKAKVVATLPYGSRFRIVEKRGGWFRVQALGGQSATGWLRASQTVSPYTMSGAGRLGAQPSDNANATNRARPRGLGTARSRTARAVRGFDRAETAAAARGFNSEHVAALGQSRADLRRGLNLLDQVIGKKPASQAVRHFQTSGGLGR